MLRLAPELPHAEVARELERIHQREHRTRTTALFARGQPGEIEVVLAGEARRFSVRPVHSELELRETLAFADSADLALLLDYEPVLPLDLRARLAGGKIYPVDEDTRLARRFGAGQVAPEVFRNDLAKALLDLPHESYGRVAGVRVTVDDAWRALLHKEAGFERDLTISAESLATFCATQPDGRPFARRLERWPQVLSGLTEYLTLIAGPVAPWIWTAWLNGRGRLGAAIALLCQGAGSRLAEEGYALATLRARLGGQFPDYADRSIDTGTLVRWGEAAAGVMRRLQGSQALDLVVEDAEVLVGADDTFASALQDSPWLDRAYTLAQRALAEALEAAAEGPGLDTFERAKAALARLKAHRRAQLPAERRSVERAEMAVRLVAYLAARPDLEAEANSGATYEAVPLHAEHHVTDGAFVDRAREEARGGDSDVFARSIRRVVVAIDEIRDADDARFAHALPAWIASRRKPDRVLPIDQALDRYAAAFLEAAEHRKLLVALLDGLSWRAAVSLLASLADHGYRPIKWRPAGSRGLVQALPVLAALPTTTEVSRSTLFAGEVPKSGTPSPSRDDPRRLENHRSLARVLRGQVPRLLLKDAVDDGSGNLSRTAVELVRSDDRLVAVVVNAIDDQLKAGRQTAPNYDMDAIRPLADLLRAATDAGRAVLIVGDHGHVPGSRLTYVQGGRDAKAARWRPLREGEDALPHEVAVSGDGVWLPRGAKRLALLYSECQTYGSAGNLGEHGGASISEVVTPAVMVASESLQQSMLAAGNADPELEVADWPAPDWWYLEHRPESRETRQSAASGETAAPAQGAFPGMEHSSLPKATAKPPSTRVDPLARELLASPALKALPADARERFRERELPWVQVLVSYGGDMPARLFAERTGASTLRVPGMVARLAERLNLDGYSVVAYDHLASRVIFDPKLFEELHLVSE